MADPMKTWFLLAYDGAEQRWYIKKAKATDQTALRNRVIPAMVQDGIFGGLQAGAVQVAGDTGDTQTAAGTIKRIMENTLGGPDVPTPYDRGIGNFQYLVGMTGPENTYSTDQTISELALTTETQAAEAEAGSPRAVFQNFLRARFGQGGRLPSGLSRMEGYDIAVEQLGSLTQAFGRGNDYLGQRKFLNDMADAAERQGIGFGRQMGVAGASALSDLASGSASAQEIFGVPDSPGDARAEAIQNLAHLALRSKMGGLGAERWGGAITANAADEYWRNIASGIPQGGGFAAFMNQRTQAPGPIDYATMFDINR